MIDSTFIGGNVDMLILFCFVLENVDFALV